MRAIDGSYFYLGWVFDRLDDQFPTRNMTLLRSILAAGGLDPEELPDPNALGPAQFVEFAEVLMLNLFQIYNPNNPEPFNRYPDQDLSLSLVNPDGTYNGNGGTSTIYRLREGIERFLITDINNPAASAKAQSEVPIMWDQLATNPQAYNHIPGGANVLYLDGHATFLRYPGQAPVNLNTAVVGGALTAGGSG
jgi:prepilin-type processing-associated H-X9-DG protein